MKNKVQEYFFEQLEIIEKVPISEAKHNLNFGNQRHDWSSKIFGYLLDACYFYLYQLKQFFTGIWIIRAMKWKLTSVTVPMGIPPCRTWSKPCKLVWKNCPFPCFRLVSSSKPYKWPQTFHTCWYIRIHCVFFISFL